jgi:hypothetical protein
MTGPRKSPPRSKRRGLSLSAPFRSGQATQSPCLVGTKRITFRIVDASDGRKTCGTIARLGVWRSLVARSVRVGEVPSSNLGTPISLHDCARGLAMARALVGGSPRMERCLRAAAALARSDRARVRRSRSGRSARHASLAARRGRARRALPAAAATRRRRHAGHRPDRPRRLRERARGAGERGGPLGVPLVRGGRAPARAGHLRRRHRNEVNSRCFWRPQRGAAAAYAPCSRSSTTTCTRYGSA